MSNGIRKWRADELGIYHVDDPTYFIAAERFKAGFDPHGVSLIPNTLPWWINHLRGKTYFTPISEVSFLLAYTQLRAFEELKNIVTDASAIFKQVHQQETYN